MFQSLRDRLLFSYLLILAAILGTFAIAVRTVFTHALDRQVTEKLIALAQGVASSLELEDGRLSIQNDFPVRTLLDQDQALEWFDAQGQSLGTQGRYRLTLMFTGQDTDMIQTQAGTPRMRGVTLPVMSADNSVLIGYVRASQSLEEFDETLRKLDFGLGGGIVVALLLSGVGGAILTRQAMQPIEQSFDKLKQFTADASHELRGPLMAIEANVEVALTYPGHERSTTDTEKFEAIASATHQMTRLTEDLLFLARTDHLPQPHQDALDLAVLLQDLVRLYQPQAEKKKIGLHIHRSQPLYMLGDSGHLRRLFTNLIVNALQYTPEGGRIDIQQHGTGKQMIISVTDTGMGISPEQLDRIFDRFWRAEQSRSYPSGGTGLGLAIAQAIARTHGGSIQVSSKVGVGSCFTVYLTPKTP